MIGRGILVLIIVPILLGLIGAILPAFGYFPPLGGMGLSLAPFQDLARLPGLWQSIWLSLFTGLIATVISTAFALILPGVLYGHRSFILLRRFLAPLLSLPHITVAVGIVFLLQPSGWLMRIISPMLTGWTRPPIWALVPDPNGFALILGLVSKEVPFLVLMTLAALSQINAGNLMTVARSLGYGRLTSWVYVIIPQLWPRLKLPVLIVLVFSLSVVDMAVVLAPSTPPPLAVRLLMLYQSPDLSMRFTASAAAVVQMSLVFIAVVIWIVGEKSLVLMARYFSFTGRRFIIPFYLGRAVDRILIAIAVVPSVAAMIGLVAAVLWSVAGQWRFPSTWPDVFTMRYWASVTTDFGDVVLVTAVLGVMSSGVAVMLVMLWLSQEDRARPSIAENRPISERTLSERALFLPLIIPQVGFLFGLQIILLWLNLDGTVLALVWVHLLFVLPYIWLSLAPSWRGFSPEWMYLAASLGASPIKRFLRVRLPIMIQPILTSFAVGFSVSAALYLPTVFAGNGRVVTLTVEAVSLASGASRNQLGVATGLQMVLPLIVFILAGVIAHKRTRRFSYFS